MENTLVKVKTEFKSSPSSSSLTPIRTSSQRMSCSSVIRVTPSKSSILRDVLDTPKARSSLNRTLSSMSLEKDELANLNERLEMYIIRNEKLEKVSSELKFEVLKVKQNRESKLSRVGTHYDELLWEAQKTSDEQTVENGKLNVEAEHFNNTTDVLKVKLERKSKDRDELRIERSKLEGELASGVKEETMTNAQINELNEQLKKLASDVQQLTKEHKDAWLNVKEKIMLNDGMTSVLHEKKEELLDSKKDDEDEDKMSVSNVEIEIKNTEVLLAENFKIQLQSIKEGLEKTFMNQVEESLAVSKEKNLILTDNLGRLLRIENELWLRRENVRLSFTSCYNIYQRSIESREAEISMLKRQLDDLDDNVSGDHCFYADTLAQRDEDMQTLKEEVTTMRTECVDLKETKEALNEEINTYRKLLDKGEKGGQRPKGFRFNLKNIFLGRSRANTSKRKRIESPISVESEPKKTKRSFLSWLKRK